MNFNPSGRSRENRLQLTRDTTRGRDENLAQLRKAREKRELEARRQNSATKIQKVIRSFASRNATRKALIARMISGDMTVLQATTTLKLFPKEQAPHLDKLVGLFLLAQPQGRADLAASDAMLTCFLEMTNKYITTTTTGSSKDAGDSALLDKLVPTLVMLVASCPEELRCRHQVVVAKLARSLIRAETRHSVATTSAVTLLHSTMVNSSGELYAELNVRALQILASGTPVGSILQLKDEPTFASLLIAYPHLAKQSDSDLFDATALDALSATTTPANASLYLRILLSSFSWRKVWASPDPLDLLAPKLSALLRLLDACGSTALANALIAALAQSDHTDPLRNLYSTDALGSFAHLAVILSDTNAPQQTIDRALQATDMLAALYIRPWLAFATTAETKRKALSLISKVSHGRGVLLALFTIGHNHLNKWAQKDGRGCLVVPYPNIMCLFCHALIHFVDTTDFRYSVMNNTNPECLTQENIRAVVNMMRNLVYRSHMQGCALDDGTRQFAQASHALLSRLHIVDEAHTFMPGAEWLAPAGGYPQMLTAEEWADGVAADDGVVEMESEDEDDSDDDGIIGRGTAQSQARAARKPPKEFDPSGSLATRTVQLLQHTPFLVPFTNRVTYFSALMYSTESHSREYWGSDEIVVEREDVFNSAFLKMRNMTPSQLLGRTRVRFRSATGELEEGFGDGVFRDFVTSICTGGFSPSAGLFEKTAEGFVYPRPFTDKLVGADHLERFQFLGRMLGKALRQGILLDVPFASFFRNLLLGRTNGINELPSLDAEIHRHLLSLRDTPADQFEYLDLTFTTTQECLGVISEVPLVRGGEHLAVTASNVMPYIHLVADYKLNRLAKRQIDAFRRGLEELVNPKWLRFFDSNELQLLFQGREDEIGLDVADWRANTAYGGEANADHPSILLFWQVVENMTPQEQRKLLKFTTSVSRAPLLGFRHMSPQFMVHLYADGDRLPSAATCMCLLKMPAYNSFEKMREKILMAIESNTFDMS